MRAHEQGFTCGHLALAKTVTEHSVANSALTPGYAAYLRKMFAKYDVDIAVLDEHRRRITIEGAQL